MHTSGRLTAALFFGLAATANPMTARSPEPVQAQGGTATTAIVAKLKAPIQALVRLVAEEKWGERLDQVVQTSPAAASLGTRWTRDLAAWKTARAAVGTRLTRIVDAYLKIDELPQLLQSETASLFAGADADMLKAALDGPAGGSIIRQQAMFEFMSMIMSLDPNGPQPGQPEFSKLVSTLRKRFDDKIGPAVPASDRAQDADVTKFSTSPLELPFRRLWSSVVGKADVQIDGAMNLILFDDRAGILRDIAAAVATVK